MKYVYPALFAKEDESILVTFPDLEDTFTDGATMQEAFDNAEDVLNLMLWNREEEKADIPLPSSPEEIIVPQGTMLVMIKADTLAYRKLHDQKTIRRSITLPSWLDTIAREHNINFSQLMQNAIRGECGIGG